MVCSFPSRTQIASSFPRSRPFILGKMTESGVCGSGSINISNYFTLSLAIRYVGICFIDNFCLSVCVVGLRLVSFSVLIISSLLNSVHAFLSCLTYGSSWTFWISANWQNHFQSFLPLESGSHDKLRHSITTSPLHEASLAVMWSKIQPFHILTHQTSFLHLS